MKSFQATLARKWDAFWKVQREVDLCQPEVDLYSGFSGAALMALAMPGGDIEFSKYNNADMYDNGDGKGGQELSLKG